MGENKALHPAVIWAQRKDMILLTVRLEDITEKDIKLDNKKMTFRAKGGHDNRDYAFEFIFFNEIDPETSKEHHTMREFQFILKKKEENEPYWPRLLETKEKISYVKTDFNNWKDEDDSDDEADNVSQNFENMMQQMGDVGVNDGGLDDTPDSDDSDDEEMPDLE